MRLSPTPVAGQQSIAYDAMGEGVTFSTPPLEAETEITGPSALETVCLLIHPRCRHLCRAARVRAGQQ